MSPLKQRTWPAQTRQVCRYLWFRSADACTWHLEAQSARPVASLQRRAAGLHSPHSSLFSFLQKCLRSPASSHFPRWPDNSRGNFQQCPKTVCSPSSTWRTRSTRDGSRWTECDPDARTFPDTSSHRACCESACFSPQRWSFCRLPVAQDGRPSSAMTKLPKRNFKWIFQTPADWNRFQKIYCRFGCYQKQFWHSNGVLSQTHELLGNFG